MPDSAGFGPGGPLRPGDSPGGRDARYRPHAKPKHTRATVRRLWGLTRGQRGGLAVSFALSGLMAASPVLGPLVIGQAVDLIGAGEPAHAACALLLALYVGDWLVRTVQGALVNAVGQLVVFGVRTDLFAAFSRLPLSYFDARSNGDLMSRVTNDVDNILGTLSTSLSELMQLVFTVAGMLVAMLVLDLRLTGVAVAGVALILAFARFVGVRTRPLFVRQQRVLGRLNGHIEESVGGLALVRAFGREEAAIRAFDEANDAYTATAVKAQIWSGYLMPVTNVASNLTFVGVAVVGGMLAAQGAIDLGLVASFLLYARQFTRPFVNVAGIYNTLQSALAGAERVFEVMDEEPEPPDAPDALPLDRPQGHVRFREVSFGYDPARPVLQDVDLDVTPGTRVAVVGATGSGKTTLVNLLVRFYDVDAGAVELDGVDVRRYRRRDLHRAFGVVLQEPALFEATVTENICFGRPGLGRAEAERAARAVGAHGFVERLPDGYDTVLVHGGAALSQGERQLLTIARAMVTDAPIFVLDEATSSVDTVTEQRIRRAVLDLTRGRTSFVIAHRLATVRDSDLIVVMDGGRIVERGTHDELVARGGIYAAMWEAQTGE